MLENALMNTANPASSIMDELPLDAELAQTEARLAELDAEIEATRAKLKVLRGAESPDLLFCKEVSQILRMPLPTVYYLAKRGKLPAKRIGGRYRFRREDILKLVA